MKNSYYLIIFYILCFNICNAKTGEKDTKNTSKESVSDGEKGANKVLSYGLVSTGIVIALLFLLAALGFRKYRNSIKEINEEFNDDSHLNSYALSKNKSIGNRSMISGKTLVNNNSTLNAGHQGSINSAINYSVNINPHYRNIGDINDQKSLYGKSFNEDYTLSPKMVNVSNRNEDGSWVDNMTPFQKNYLSQMNSLKPVPTFNKMGISYSSDADTSGTEISFTSLELDFKKGNNETETDNDDKDDNHMSVIYENNGKNVKSINNGSPINKLSVNTRLNNEFLVKKNEDSNLKYENINYKSNNKNQYPESPLRMTDITNVSYSSAKSDEISNNTFGLLPRFENFEKNNNRNSNSNISSDDTSVAKRNSMTNNKSKKIINNICKKESDNLLSPSPNMAIQGQTNKSLSNIKVINTCKNQTGNNNTQDNRYSNISLKSNATSIIVNLNELNISENKNNNNSNNGVSPRLNNGINNSKFTPFGDMLQKISPIPSPMSMATTTPSLSSKTEDGNEIFVFNEDKVSPGKKLNININAGHNNTKTDNNNNNNNNNNNDNNINNNTNNNTANNKNAITDNSKNKTQTKNNKVFLVKKKQNSTVNNTVNDKNNKATFANIKQINNISTNIKNNHEISIINHSPVINSDSSVISFTNNQSVISINSQTTKHLQENISIKPIIENIEKNEIILSRSSSLGSRKVRKARKQQPSPSHESFNIDVVQERKTESTDGSLKIVETKRQSFENGKINIVESKQHYINNGEVNMVESKRKSFDGKNIMVVETKSVCNNNNVNQGNINNCNLSVSPNLISSPNLSMNTSAINHYENSYVISQSPKLNTLDSFASSPYLNTMDISHSPMLHNKMINLDKSMISPISPKMINIDVGVNALSPKISYSPTTPIMGHARSSSNISNGQNYNNSFCMITSPTSPIFHDNVLTSPILDSSKMKIPKIIAKNVNSENSYISSSQTPKGVDNQNYCRSPIPSYVNNTEKSKTFSYMSKKRLYKVYIPWNPQNIDEIKIRNNDIVKIKKYYEDGYAYGYNISTNEKGIFPISSLIDNENRPLAYSPLIVNGRYVSTPRRIESREKLMNI